jgi:hypothetical protein
MDDALEPTAPKKSIHKAHARSVWVDVVIGASISVAISILAIFVALLIPQSRAQLVRFLTPLPPTPPCIQPTIAIGPASFRIEMLKLAQDGSLVVPADSTGIAYWIEGTSPSYVFALSPTADDFAILASVKVGDISTIQWGDCSQESYVVGVIENGRPDLSTLLAAHGMTVYAIDNATGLGMVISNSPEGAAPLETNIPEEAGTQAEVSFLDTSAAPDGTAITMRIEILNTGSEPIYVGTTDISLTPEGGTPLSPLRVEPPLPVEILPGARQGLEITFPEPVGSPAVFRILDFTVDQYY